MRGFTAALLAVLALEISAIVSAQQDAGAPKVSVTLVSEPWIVPKSRRSESRKKQILSGRRSRQENRREWQSWNTPSRNSAVHLFSNETYLPACLKMKNCSTVF